MRITAHHAHLFPKQVREDGAIDPLLHTLDACEIEECVTFAPFAKQMHRQDTSANQWLKQEISGCDRLFGFGTIDFEKENIKDQVQEVIDLGFKGIKLHPAYQHFHVMDDRARQVYQCAEDFGLFLTFHTGVHWDRIANYQVLLFDEVAYNYRKLRFSMEHIGGYSFAREALAVLANNNRDKSTPQVYGGFTSIFDLEKNRLWYLTPEERELAVYMAGENGIIYGLDFPYNKEEKIKEGIRAILDMSVSMAVKEKILGGSLRKVLDIQ